MSVLKQYNTGTSTWETIVVGQQGEPGIETGSVAPANTSVLWMDTADAGSQVAVPSGGNAGQVLAKTSATDYATAWTDTDGHGNVIINGGFDVWQRGTSFPYSGTVIAYNADRFMIYTAATTTTGTVSRQAFTPGTAPVSGYEGQYFLRVATTTISGANIHSIWQKIEDVRTFAGQTVTLSFWAKADASRTFGIRYDQIFGTGGSGEVVAAVGVFNANTSWQRFSTTFTLPSVAGKTIGPDNTLSILFDLPQVNGSTFDIWGVQLEAGSYASPFKRNAPSLQAEIAACQRYYYRISLTGTNQAFCLGWSDSSTVFVGTVPFPQIMRIRPTALETTGVASDYAAVNPAASMAATSVTSYDGTSGNFQGTIVVTGGGGLTIRSGGQIRSNSSSAFFAWSVEL